MSARKSLVGTVEARQRSLEDHLREALVPHRDPRRPRDGYAATDTFLAATSRHMAAVEAVLLKDVARRVPDGHALRRDYLHAARALELTLSLVKARLYGEAHSIHLEWSGLWDTVRSDLTEHNALERRLASELTRHVDPSQSDELARRLPEAEMHAPTRTHPRLPHTGVPGQMARRIWALADRFWDTAEGRVIPEIVPAQPHRHDSLLAQYLVADPKFDDHARLIEHRHRHKDEPGGQS